MPSKKRTLRCTIAPAKAKAPARTLATFKAAHDPAVIIPKKIQAAVDAMKTEGPETFAYESQDDDGQKTMTERTALGAAILARYRKQFAQYIVKTGRAHGSKKNPKFVWFGDPEVATEARGGPVNMADFE